MAVVSVALLVGCGPGGPVAVVEDDPIERSELDALAPGAVDAEQEASSLFLLILHRLLVDAAARDFGVAVDEADVDAAFADRTRGLDDVDAALTERGVTRRRVTLEAELDALRRHLEEEMVVGDRSAVDMDEAYRDFLAANSRACMVVLNLADASLTEEVEERVEAGEDLDDIFADHPDRTARLDLGCHSPLQHGMELAPVALDGEVGTSYARHPESGGVYVAKVTERDAPPLAEVEEEVIALAVDTQGPQLFDAWAADVLRTADVEVHDSIGTWEPSQDTGDIPTVVPQ